MSSPHSKKRKHSSSPSPTRKKISSPGKSPISSTALPSSPVATLNLDEVYDRQIRLWGREAQDRLNSSRIAIIGGAYRHLAAELTKNLALAGVGHLRFVDDSVSRGTEDPFIFHYPVSKAVDVLAHGAKKLNSVVKVESISNIALKDIGKRAVEILEGVNLAVLCDVPVHLAIEFNEKARKYNVPVLIGNVMGLNSYAFADLLEHQFLKEITHPPKEKDQEPTMEYVQQCLKFLPFKEALEYRFPEPMGRKSKRRRNGPTLSFLAMMALLKYATLHQGNYPAADSEWELVHKYALELSERHHAPDVIEGLSIDDLRHYLRGPVHEFPPTAAITGGILAQEAIKVVQHKHRPITNFIVYCADDGISKVFNLNVIEA